MGLAPLKVNMVVKRGTNDQSVVDMARFFKGSGHILRFIEFMDVGHTNGWKMEHVVPSRELVRDDQRSIPDRAPRRQLPRRSRRTLALQGRLRRNRLHLLGNPGVLQGLHARAAVRGRLDLYLPVRHAGHRPAQPDPRRRLGRRHLRGHRQGLARAHRPLFRDPHRRDRQAAQGRNVLHRWLTFIQVKFFNAKDAKVRKVNRNAGTRRTNDIAANRVLMLIAGKHSHCIRQSTTMRLQLILFCFSFAYLCAADIALAEPSGVGGSASARYPQTADSVGNVSACPFALNAFRI